MPIEEQRGGRVEFLGLPFDPLDLSGVTHWLSARTIASPFGYVVTPNVDHLLRIEAQPQLRPLYEAADLCVNDSRVLRRLAGSAGAEIGLAPGSDLTPHLLAAIAQPGDHLAVVGGDSTSLHALQARFPSLVFHGLQPPMGLARDRGARSAVVDWLAEHPVRFILLAVGSPQQEMIAAEARASGRVTGTALCIGASIDFVTGSKARAPRIVQQLSLEWAWRLLSEPRRLGRRYLVEAPRIFPLVRRWKQARSAAAERGSSRA